MSADNVNAKMPTRSWWACLCAFLNSTFASWFLPSVVIMVVLWAYAEREKREAKEAAARLTESTLSTELTFRLKQYFVTLRSLKPQLDERAKTYKGVNPNAAGFLLRLYREAEQPTISTSPEYQRHSLYSLLRQYQQFAGSHDTEITRSAAAEALRIATINNNILNNPDINNLQENVDVLVKFWKVAAKTTATCDELLCLCGCLWTITPRGAGA